MIVVTSVDTLYTIGNNGLQYVAGKESKYGGQ